MPRRHHPPIHELVHYFICPNKLSHSSWISWHKHKSSIFWFRTCLDFSAYIAGIHFFIWIDVMVHRSRQLKNEIQWLAQTNGLAQISRNAAILYSKRRTVLVAWSSNLIIDKIRCTIVFPLRARASFGGVLLQVKSLPWNTFVFSSVLSPFSECSAPVFQAVRGHQCQQHRAESTSQSKSSSTASSKPSEPLSQISSPVCLPSSLTSLSETRRLIS